MKGMEYSERGNAGGRKGKGGHAQEGGAIVAEEGLGGGGGGGGGESPGMFLGDSRVCVGCHEMFLVRDSMVCFLLNLCEHPTINTFSRGRPETSKRQKHS